MRPDPFRFHRRAYPYFRRVIARFSDMDSEGHLNNVALASFYEDGRVSFLREIVSDEMRAGARFVIAHLSIAYLLEAHYPGDYEVGLGVGRIGTTSFDLGCALFVGGTCVGTCDTTQVTLGADARPRPLPETMRATLAANSLRTA